MDFFASQELARKNTRRLIVLYLLALVALTAAIYALCIFAFFGLAHFGGKGFTPENFASAFRFDVLGYVAAGTSMLIGGGSAFKVAALRGGGESVASLLGGRKLQPNSRTVEERRILNVVEEMALAAGTPVPPVYILDDEQGINAFAAGYTIDDAVIGLNRGTIETLNRDELQGVVAHEFSHILNGDMRMSIRMIGILHGIQLIALLGYFLLRSIGGSSRHHHSNRDNGGGKGAMAMLLMGVGLIAVGGIGIFFARWIKASVSRQREFLADASAVQFTRNPEGIAGALKMIGAHSSQIHQPAAEEASHMFFGSMFGGASNLFATHPPLIKRIQKVDPRFDGDFVAYARRRVSWEQRLAEADQRRKQREQEHQRRLGGVGGMGGFGGQSPGGLMEGSFPIDPLILIAGIGNPDENDVEYSELVVDRIPEVLVEASHDVFDARCIVFVSLLNHETEIRRAQLHALATNEGQATIDRTIALMKPIDALEARFRLPLFEIIQGTLTGMSPQQHESFRDSVDRLVEADNRIDVFEFFLRQHTMVHLDRRFGKVQPPRVRYRAINPLQTEICRLLSILVRLGHEHQSEFGAAWKVAMVSLGKPAWADDTSALAEPLNAKQLQRDIEKVNQAAPVIKKRILTAMAAAMTSDGKITVGEAEIFRAMSESLDCPVPPVIAGPTNSQQA